MFELRDEGSAKQVLRERLRTKDWWFILWADAATPEGSIQAGEFIADVERTYYEGEKNDGFEIMCFVAAMSPLVGVVLAKKEHMSTNQLAKIMNRHMSRQVTPSDVEAQDIICPNVRFDIVTKFAKWVGDPEAD